MKEPGLDNRHRDKNPPKAGEIQQKRSDTLNKNLPKPISSFHPMRSSGPCVRKQVKQAWRQFEERPNDCGRDAPLPWSCSTDWASAHPFVEWRKIQISE